MYLNYTEVIAHFNHPLLSCHYRFWRLLHIFEKGFNLFGIWLKRMKCTYKTVILFKRNHFRSSLSHNLKAMTFYRIWTANILMEWQPIHASQLCLFFATIYKWVNSCIFFICNITKVFYKIYAVLHVWIEIKQTIIQYYKEIHKL